VIECKNATKDEAIALGVDQVRRYHAETPELLSRRWSSPHRGDRLFLRLTWNLIATSSTGRTTRRGILEAKVKSFLRRGHVLALLKDYILLRRRTRSCRSSSSGQHQATGRGARGRSHVSAPAKDRSAPRLVCTPRGAARLYDDKAAELLFKAAGADKPIALVLIDRNELEDQMLRNLAMLGLNNVQHAHSIAALNSF